MYALSGITGHVGGAVARALLDAKQLVRAVLRNPKQAVVWSKQGCDVALADFNDPEALSAVFTGADGVFVMCRRCSEQFCFWRVIFFRGVGVAPLPAVHAHAQGSNSTLKPGCSPQLGFFLIYCGEETKRTQSVRRIETPIAPRHRWRLL